MNLIDAIKSGKPFRRLKSKYCPAWQVANKKSGLLVDLTTCCSAPLMTADDLVADDWEIQERTVTITRTQFWESILAAKKECEVVYGRDVGRMLQTAARKLGLEDIGTPGGHGFDNRGVCKCGHRTSYDPERCKLGLEEEP